MSCVLAPLESPQRRRDLDCPANISAGEVGGDALLEILGGGDGRVDDRIAVGLGKEVDFYRFPGENHELSRTGSPIHCVQRAEIILDWFAAKLG